MIRESIIKLSKKQNLTYLEAEEVMDEIMSGKATPVQMSAYLTALALKGETIDEITASAAGMRAQMCIRDRCKGNCRSSGNLPVYSAYKALQSQKTASCRV